MGSKSEVRASASAAVARQQQLCLMTTKLWESWLTAAMSYNNQQQGDNTYQAPTTRGIAMAIGTGVKRAIFLGPKSLKQNQGTVTAWFAVVPQQHNSVGLIGRTRLTCDIFCWFDRKVYISCVCINKKIGLWVIVLQL